MRRRKARLGRIPEFQKKLNEKIDYQLLVQTTMDKVLNELLAAQGVPYTVNETAFTLTMQDKDVVKTAVVDKGEKMIQVTRATVLKTLLAKIPSSDVKGQAMFILRPDRVEITTLEAVGREFYPGRLGETHLPSLAYALFKETPLRKALAELARSTESNVILDGKSAEEAESKVTAEFSGVPADAAVQVLADMAGLQLVRLGNIYYVTSPENARRLTERGEPT